MMTDLALDAHIRAEQAEIEAANLRIELKRAHESIIAIKRVGLAKAETDFNFYTLQLLELGGLSVGEVAEDKAHVEALRPILEKDIAAFRARWGCDPK